MKSTVKIPLTQIEAFQSGDGGPSIPETRFTPKLKNDTGDEFTLDSECFYTVYNGRCFFDIAIKVTALPATPSSDGIYISDLPFAVDRIDGISCAVGYYKNIGINVYDLKAYMFVNIIRLNVKTAISDSMDQEISANGVPINFTLYLSGNYKIAEN